MVSKSNGISCVGTTIVLESMFNNIYIDFSYGRIFAKTTTFSYLHSGIEIKWKLYGLKIKLIFPDTLCGNQRTIIS